MPRNNMNRYASYSPEQLAARYTQLLQEAIRTNEPVPGEGGLIRAELLNRVGRNEMVIQLNKATKSYHLLMPQEFLYPSE